MKNLFDLINMNEVATGLVELDQLERSLPFDVSRDELETLRYKRQYYSTIITAKDHIYERDKRIAELEAASRWIPVSERLPEEGEYVLVTFAKRDSLVACGRLSRVAWFACGRYWSDEQVLAWRPLPEPYDPESHE
jgi:hypothetical protein